jgi:hypothetical protein
VRGTAARATRPTVREFRRAVDAWWARWHGVVVRCVAALVIALAGYLAFFAEARAVTIDIGRFPDRLVLSGFNNDERDNGVTYRWTKTASHIAIPGYGAVREAHVEVVARNGRGARVEVPFSVDLGAGTATLAAGETFTPALADVRARDGGADLSVTVRAERYDAPGDPRVLGVQVDRVRVEPQWADWWAGAWGGLPWAARFVLLAVALALVVPRPWGGALGGGGAAALAFLCFAVPESRLIVAPLLLPLAGAAVVGGAAVRWRDTSALLNGWWNALDRPAALRWGAGTVVAVFVVVAAVVVSRVDFIGHADYADNAVRARSIVQGHGDTIPYVPQFYTRFATIPHPAETWPPLQVWLIAVAFRLFGVATAIAKLPNILVMAGLIALVAWVGAWRWSRRVGLLAALLVALTPLFFEYTLFPVNDLVFTLLFAAFIVALYRAWCEPRSAAGLSPMPPASGYPAPTRGGESEPPPVSGGGRGWVPDFAVGIAAGLLLLAKPSGSVLIVGAAATALVVNRAARRRTPWRGIGVAAGAAALCYLPWALRNLVTFGTPLHSTESYDAWIEKYHPTQPNEGIYQVFFLHGLPHPRVLVGYGYDHFLSVQTQQFVRLWQDATAGALVPVLLLPFVLLGCILGASRRPGFGALLAGAGTLYTLFVLLYWHYEARYFVVFVPWLLLYAASGIEWTYDALVTWFAGLWQRALVPLAVLVLLLAVVVPQARDIQNRAASNMAGNQMVRIGQWLEANTPPDAVIMTRNPWEISWHSNRQTVMLPLGSFEDIQAVIKQYGVTMIELDHLNDTSTMRQSLAPLYSYKPMPSITPRYDPGDNTFLVFDVAAKP